MSNDWVDTISNRYIELYEQVIGGPFIPEPLSQEETYDRIIENLQILKLA
jgi:phosphoribosylaminoimidazole-succinocarboxamide synthase